MSRKFDEYMMDKFEFGGELYELVEPDSFDTLVEAFRMKNFIIANLDANIYPSFDELLYQQDTYIKDYVNKIGEYDYTVLSKNINYLLRENSIRMGELEEMLGISMGYISRTVKEKSPKKMSIDVVWKIATIFNISLEDIISKDLEAPHDNNELALSFINRLIKQTKNNEIQWSQKTIKGSLCDDRLERCHLLRRVDEKDDFNTEFSFCYTPKELQEDEIALELADDIFCCSDVDEMMDLIIVPHVYGGGTVFYDYVLLDRFIHTTTYTILFQTAFGDTNEILELSEKLMKCIHSREDEVSMTKNTRKFINGYLNGKR